MQKITDHLYVIDKNKLKNLLAQPPVNAEGYVRSMSGTSLKGKIIIEESELLDLMQESVEHSYTTLIREKAEALLNAKLDPSNPFNAEI